MNQQSNVQGWLMDVPGYRENYRNERRHLLDIEESDETSQKRRPCSLLSISSEDSINLDDLINANFTTDMEDETDLSALSALDLDDSHEDFWKMDNFLNHLTHPFPPKDKGIFPHDDSNRSTYEEDLFSSKNTSLDDLSDSFYHEKVTEHDFMASLKLSSSYGEFDNPRLLQVPVSPKTSPIIHRERMHRSGSISSENSMNSASTITPHYRALYPSTSTSTSSIGSHSTAASSFLPRSTTSNKNTTERITQPRFRPAAPPASLSETTSTRQQVGLTRRATHIPAPAATSTSPSPHKKTLIASPNRTKSTTLAHKKSNPTLGRSASRIGGGGGSRASHIPTPPRSTTSLGISSIFTSQQERPKTSLGSTLKSPSNLRRAPSTLPTLTKSTGLRLPTRKLV
ncbi:uncharacterized protein EV154DRAFT_527838 [Mucor mucedo]|uniref:uncharacterized protein n=1 Tax=Mucor mucedo TaxID=29922 RepID=UPI00221EA976|nr:uncharacterized protein EV154DRAFT_527838 [Mucor mucedo]KAI7873611.1 hypothetical protein EV154DRAFT_527838 [Mucor mucedo]